MGSAIGLITSQKKTAGGSPGPPFALNSANNGLSVDALSGQIVLGNDIGGSAAALITNRSIPMPGRSFQFDDGAGNAYFLLDAIGNNYTLGDSVAGAAFLAVDAGNNRVDIFAAGNEVETLDGLNGLYTIGDVTNAVNGNKIVVSDAADFFQYLSHLHTYFLLDVVNKVYKIGDIDLFTNGSFFQVDDTNQTVRADVNANATDSFFQLSDIGGAGGVFNVSLSNGGVNTNSMFNLDGATQVGTLGNSNIAVLVDGVNKKVEIGDTAGVGNGTLFTLDDTLQLSTFTRPVTINNGAGVATVPLTVKAVAGQTGHQFDLFDPAGVQSSYFGRDGGLKITGAITNNYVGIGPELELNGAGQAVWRGFNRVGVTYIQSLFDSLSTIISNSGTPGLTIDTNGITTADPLSGTAPVRMGNIVAGAVALDATRYWEVKINGVVKKVLVAA